LGLSDGRLYLAGCVVLTTTAIPQALDNDAGVPGLAVAMILVGLGVGSVKATLFPFLGDQYVQQKPQLVQRKNGEMVVVDGSRTLQFLYNAYYWYANCCENR
jgi:POT family proton-dependent oligopeptide transporter